MLRDYYLVVFVYFSAVIYFYVAFIIYFYPYLLSRPFRLSTLEAFLPAVSFAFFTPCTIHDDDIEAMAVFTYEPERERDENKRRYTYEKNFST